VASPSRWVVVGYGMGAYHARLMKEVDGIRLHGVCDIDEAKRRRASEEHPGIHTYASLSEVLIDRSVDGVVIVTPHNQHAPMAIEAMRAGRHVITDKAMCLTVAEAEAMMAERDRAGVLLSVFHNRRWDGDFLTVRQVIEDGVIGRPYHIQSCVTSYGSPGGWRTQREAMGGWLYDWGAHTIDQILLLAGSPPRTVHAYWHFRRESPKSVEDFISCTVAFESGLTAHTVIGYLNHVPMPRWYVMGETGGLIADDFERPLRVRTRIGHSDADVTIPLQRSDWRAFYANIAAALRGAEELAVKPEQLIHQIAIAEAAYRSIATEQVVRLTDAAAPAAAH